MNRTITNCLALIWLLLSPLVGIAAEAPKPARPVKHQITGLFSRDRQRDLQETFDNLAGIELVEIEYATAEATLTYDAAKVFPDAKNAEQLVKKFDRMLRQVSRSTFGVKAVCTVPRDQLRLIEIPVVGLDCKGCSLVAYEAVYRLEGVEQATASFKLGLVTAWIHPAKTDRTKLEAALVERKVKLRTP